ncbi:hypothetical protein LTR10_001870 [Elasticomyces elasticus]|nr:hypothetical protein LTR10_001870 [Elasticomyces elasticus]KAK4975369.1 hypothetical protein LTR42_004579 [Elasticomyces elasticus]
MSTATISTTAMITTIGSTTAALTASPRYRDERTSDQRFCAIARYFEEVGLSDGAYHKLRCQELDPREETDDPAPFDDYFQSFDKGRTTSGIIAPFVATWLAEDIKDTASRFPAVRELLRDIKDCEYALAAVSLVAKEPEGHDGPEEDSAECMANRAKCITKVDEVRAITARLQSQFRVMISSSPFVEAYRKDQACYTTSDLFDIPELVEHILKFVDNEDVLRLQAVNRTFNKVIEGSSTLQRTLGLRPDVNSHLVLPFRIPYSFNHCRGAPGFGCYSQAADSSLLVALGHHNLNVLQQLCSRHQPPAELADVKVHTRLEISDGKLLTIGSRYQAMLLCQPPISKMTMRLCYIYISSQRGPEEVEMDLYGRDEDGAVFEDGRMYRRTHPGTEPIVPTVVAEGPGLTLGQLWDTEILLRDQKQLCQEMCEQYTPGDLTTWWPNENKVIVHFEGTLRLRYDDPVIAPVSHWSETATPWWSTVTSYEKKQRADYSERASAFRGIMRAAEMRDRNNPTAAELQVAWSTFREVVKRMEECELEDADTFSEGQLISEVEST